MGSALLRSYFTSFGLVAGIGIAIDGWNRRWRPQARLQAMESHITPEANDVEFRRTAISTPPSGHLLAQAGIPGELRSEKSEDFASSDLIRLSHWENPSPQSFLALAFTSVSCPAAPQFLIARNRVA